MTSKTIDYTLARLAQHYQIGLTATSSPISSNAQKRTYTSDQQASFVNDLISESQTMRLLLLEQQITPSDWPYLIQSGHHALLFFEQTPTGLIPLIICWDKKGKVYAEHILSVGPVSTPVPTSAANLLQDSQSEGLIFYTAFPEPSLGWAEPGETQKPLTPVQRLFKLLGNEKKDIIYIYVYAVIIGLVSLALPLGIQAIIGLISGGMVFNSVVVLISLVVLAVLITGGLQIMQITLVEILQRRIFAKAAFEFAWRLPRFELKGLSKYYPPELMNRFFDVITIQKGLPKLLIDLTSAALQILFGLLLLAFYHPFFVFFGIILLLFLFIIFRITGPKGLETSLYESKYKYKVVAWLQEMARSILSFKMAAKSPLSLNRTHELTENYLAYRKKHFGVLLVQFSYIIVFKTLITGGLLVLGTLLVVDRQITLGQFVASEIIIITIVGAVEKMIISMETVYDLLTGVEKIGNVTDLPIERQHGLYFEQPDQPFSLNIESLSCSYEKSRTLQNVSLSIPAGQSLCIAAMPGAGRNTLIRTLIGDISDFQGSVMVNGVSLRDLSLPELRQYVSTNPPNSHFFEGSLYENLTMGRADINVEAITKALNLVGMASKINSMPEGLFTQYIPESGKFSETAIQRLLLARTLLSRPRLLIFQDFLLNLEAAERLRIMAALLDKSNGHTLLVISNQPAWLSSVDKVVLLKKGQIDFDGSWADFSNSGKYNQIKFDA